MRISQVKALYAYSFDPNQQDESIADIIPHIASIDALITKHTVKFDISKINKIDLAILRLGVFELTKKGIQPQIAIDEAIEIAKEYGADASSSFVNAVLSAVSKESVV